MVEIMNSQNNSINNVDKLIFAFCDGEITDEKEIDLMSILSKDRSARSLFKFHLGLKQTTTISNSKIYLPEKVENNIHKMLSLKAPGDKCSFETAESKLYFWKQRISLTPLAAAAVCIFIFLGTLSFSKIFLLEKTKYTPRIRAENIENISELRKHIKKIKITNKDQVDFEKKGI